MRALFEIVHPADVLFFRRPMESLRARGDEILVLSRQKDIACALLDEFGIAHRPVSTAATGHVRLAAELVRRGIAMYRAARAFRPDVMIGFGGVAISHAGRATGIPSISFYDSENATLQTRLTWPFITHLYVPRAYGGPTPAGRTTRLPGVKELSFLHPGALKADRGTALAAGLDPGRENFFVRVVAWRANHDLGKAGWPVDLLRAVVARLSEAGAVHLSSETPLPDDLRQHAYRGPKNAVHHLLAHCRMLVGESATMASEAAVLGVPAIYAGRDFPGYTRELEAAGLTRNIPPADTGSLLPVMEEMLARPRQETSAARDRYVASCPDWGQAVVDALDRHAATGR
jgi:predicted glycosyltransferase